MKKIWLFILLIICSIIAIWCSNDIPEFNDYTRGCGVYNEDYPARHNTNDWTDLRVAVRSWTTFEYIKDIIWKENICFGWTNLLREKIDELPDDAIGYRFSLKIYPNNDGLNKARQIKENLKDDNNVYEVRIQPMWYN